MNIIKNLHIFKSTQGVNYCGYKINEYRPKIRDKGKRKLKNKIKKLKGDIICIYGYLKSSEKIVLQELPEIYKN